MTTTQAYERSYQVTVCGIAMMFCSLAYLFLLAGGVAPGNPGTRYDFPFIGVSIAIACIAEAMFLVATRNRGSFFLKLLALPAMWWLLYLMAWSHAQELTTFNSAVVMATGLFVIPWIFGGFAYLFGRKR